jgi:hypothetical protein
MATSKEGEMKIVFLEYYEKFLFDNFGNVNKIIL